MNIIIAVFKRFFTERFHDQSAQMGYYFMLSIFPFLIFAVSIISFFPIQTNDLLAAIEPYAPQGSYELIKENLAFIVGGKLAYFSLIAAFWVASMAVQSFVRAMNDAYRIVRKEGFFLALGKDLILTGSVMLTLTVSLLVPIGEEIGRVYLSSHLELPPSFHYSWLIFKWVFGSVYLFIFFLCLYKFVPSKKISFASTVPGAVFATLCWQAVSVAFSYYVTFAKYSLLYGQLGSLIVLMIWFYLTAAVLLTGGLVNVYVMDKKEGDIREK